MGFVLSGTRSGSGWAMASEVLNLLKLAGLAEYFSAIWTTPYRSLLGNARRSRECEQQSLLHRIRRHQCYHQYQRSTITIIAIAGSRHHRRRRASVLPHSRHLSSHDTHCNTSSVTYNLTSSTSSPACPMSPSTQL